MSFNGCSKRAPRALASAPPRALVAFVAAGCASTIDGTARDGGADVIAAQDVPSTMGPCRWRALPPVDLTARSAPRARLVDAIATGDGAWVAYRERSPARATDALWIARVDGDGRARPARESLLGLAPTDSLELSMDWDGARGTLALLAEGMTDRGACVWIATNGATERTSRQLDPGAAGMGFARSGCRALLRTRDGYSFASEQVRALWGTDLITLSRGGDLTGFRTLPMPAAPAEGLTRTALANGDFVATWGESMGRESALRVRRFSEEGEPRGPLGTLAAADAPFKQAVVVETAAGMLALWEGAADTFPRSEALLARPLDGLAAPAGEPIAHTALGFFLGGLSATRRGAEALATAVSARDGIRLSVLSLDARGVARATLDTGLADTDGPTRTARVVATPAGALVFATVAQGADGGVVVAVPLRCE